MHRAALLCFAHPSDGPVRPSQVSACTKAGRWDEAQALLREVEEKNIAPVGAAGGGGGRGGGGGLGGRESEVGAGVRSEGGV
jgi:pentatricopeptide repeat protein